MKYFNIIILLFFNVVAYSQGNQLGTFESQPTPFVGNCAVLTSLAGLSGGTWTALNPAQSPTVCHTQVYPTNANNPGNNYMCVLEQVVENGEITTNTGLKTANFSINGSDDGYRYALSFEYANLGTIAGFEGDFSTNVIVSINDLQYVFSVPPYDPEIEWKKVEISFCAEAGPTNVALALSIANNDNAMSTRIAIDNIDLLNKDRVMCSCTDCNSFKLVPEEKYIISGWLTMDNNEDALTYASTTEYAGIDVTFLDEAGAPLYDENENQIILPFYPSGPLIDGWQKIEGEFTVPLNTSEISIDLNNMSGSLFYYDDIRVHPVNSNLKSFVYDLESFKLLAELDENNYGTFYEYDKEGGLVRVKKETERGVFTIQESRSSNRKKEGE